MTDGEVIASGSNSRIGFAVAKFWLGVREMFGVAGVDVSVKEWRGRVPIVNPLLVCRMNQEGARGIKTGTSECLLSMNPSDRTCVARTGSQSG